MYRVRRAAPAAQIAQAFGSRAVARSCGQSEGQLAVDYRRPSARDTLARPEKRYHAEHPLLSQLLNDCAPLSADEARRRMAMLVRRSLGITVTPGELHGDKAETFCRLLCRAAGGSGPLKSKDVHDLQSVQYYKQCVRKLKDIIAADEGAGSCRAEPGALGAPLQLDAQANVFVSTKDAQRWLMNLAQVTGGASRPGLTVTAQTAGHVAQEVYCACVSRARRQGLHDEGLSALRAALTAAAALIACGHRRDRSHSRSAADTADRLLQLLNRDAAANFSSAWQVATFAEELRHWLGDPGYASDEKCLDEVLKTIAQLHGEALHGKLAGLERALADRERDRSRAEHRITVCSRRLKLVRLLDQGRAVLTAASAARGES